MQPTKLIPTISGWSVVLEDQTYVATRADDLTDFQRRWGAVHELEARTEIELWVLCDAQTRLAERLTVAEAARPRISPHPKVLARRANQGGLSGSTKRQRANSTNDAARS